MSALGKLRSAKIGLQAMHAMSASGGRAGRGTSKPGAGRKKASP